ASATIEGDWWMHRPGLRARAEGPRYPDPGWCSTLSRTRLLSRGQRLIANAIPAGLWLHGDGDADPNGDQDSAFALPPDPDRVTVLIGRPGGRCLEADEVATVLMRLSPAAADRLLLIPYGPDRELSYAVAERLAVDGRRVDVACGGLGTSD